MLKENEMDMLHNKLKPLADEVSETFRRAMLLRVTVHVELALSNGAEDEDINAVIIEAIRSAAIITEKFMNEICDLKKSRDFPR